MGWTPKTLKVYCDARFQAQDSATKDALAALKEGKSQNVAVVAVIVTIGVAVLSGIAGLIFYLVTRK